MATRKPTQRESQGRRAAWFASGTNHQGPIQFITGRLSIPFHPASRVPVWTKWGFTAFMAVLVPGYWANYGPTNFLDCCDTTLFTLFLTLFDALA